MSDGLTETPPASTITPRVVGVEEGVVTPAEVPPVDNVEHAKVRALRILAVLAIMYAVYAAHTLLFPILLALLLAMLFRPVHRRMRRLHLPEQVNAAIIVGLLTAASAMVIMQVVQPVAEWLGEDPRETFLQAGEKLQGVVSSYQQLNRAARMVNEMSSAGGDGTVEGEPAPAGDEGLEIANQGANVEIDVAEAEETVQTGDKQAEQEADPDVAVNVAPAAEAQSSGLIPVVLSFTGSFLAGAILTMVLLYFLLATGDRFLNSVVQIMPTIRDKRNVVEVVHNVEKGVSNYLLTVSAINFCLGVVIGTAMWLIGIPTPLVWGAMAMVLNYIPYLGAMAGSCVVFLVGLLTEDMSLAHAALAPLAYMTANTIEGNFITPTILGHSMRLNPLVVFFTLAFAGWLWGIGGAILAVPILACFAVICDQFESTSDWATLLHG